MKKYFATSLLSLMLMFATSAWVTAGEQCDGKTKTTQTSAVQSAEKASCGHSSTSADVSTQAVPASQTSNVEKSGCTGTAATTSSCTGTKTTTTASQTQAGECTKAPAGVGAQRASREL
jgi:hypothetical protein